MEKIKNGSIVLPENPFWEVFKRFGRDEVIALVINVLATALTAFLLKVFGTSTETTVLILALAGPVIEKIGFYPGHVWEARKEFRATPKKHRQPLKFYTKKPLKGAQRA